MPSPALVNFNAFVDNLSVNAARKVELKTKGEDFYVRVVKEVAHHVRKHLQAAIAQGAADPTKAAEWDSILQRCIDEEALLTLETADAILGA